MIWEAMLKGMASAGWLVGFVVILGLFLVFVGLIGLGFMAIFGGNEEEDEETPSVSSADSSLREGARVRKAEDTEEVWDDD